eukprot:gnl/Chilomastix_cuspidata/1231.p2 GENE.gnl/Chilomastix_cuspidata/1231~~gnl/Chilomastix_cuspidata/1231.p2  ORF type:complete len:320 (-),score=119.63 gnl/Chilomastix_cuspidata/1231:32-991(-)
MQSRTPATTIHTIFDEVKTLAQRHNKKYPKFLSRVIFCASILDTIDPEQVVSTFSEIASSTGTESTEQLTGAALISSSYVAVLVEGQHEDVTEFLLALQYVSSRWGGLPANHPLVLREQRIGRRMAATDAMQDSRDAEQPLVSNPVILLFQEDIPRRVTKSFHIAFPVAFPSSHSFPSTSPVPCATEAVAGLLEAAVEIEKGAGGAAPAEGAVERKAQFAENSRVANRVPTLPVREYFDFFLGELAPETEADLGDAVADLAEYKTMWALECAELFRLDEFVDEFIWMPPLEFPEDSIYALHPHWLFDNLHVSLERALPN